MHVTALSIPGRMACGTTARFARCKTLACYLTHPPVCHEQPTCFYPTKTRSTWTCPRFYESLIVSTSLHLSFLTSSPTSSAGEGTESAFETSGMETSCGSSSTWTTCVSLLRCSLSLLSLHRFSTLLTLPVLRSGNAYVNSEQYVVPGDGCRSRTYSPRVLFLSLMNTLQPLGVLVISIKGR